VHSQNSCNCVFSIFLVSDVCSLFNYNWLWNNYFF